MRDRFPPVLRLLLGPVGPGIADPVGLEAFAVDVPLGIYQDSLVPAGAYIVGYDVFSHLLTRCLTAIMLWAAKYVNRWYSPGTSQVDSEADKISRIRTFESYCIPWYN